MKRTLSAVLTAAMLAATAAPALAEDGHGNAANPERSVPNTGGVAGGPAHRDDPRVSESRERRPDGTPAHGAGDGHAHGHSQDAPAKR